jgi:hypothetical protein
VIIDQDLTVVRANEAGEQLRHRGNARFPVTALLRPALEPSTGAIDNKTTQMGCIGPTTNEIQGELPWSVPTSR